MAADVELLPLPEEEWNVRYGYYADTMQDYARACVAHATAAKDAEIEALRAEVVMRRRLLDAMRKDKETVFAHWLAAVAQAGRLAEALRDAMGYINSMNYPVAIAKIDALLRDQEEGYWPKLEGKGGTDWTGFDG